MKLFGSNSTQPNPNVPTAISQERLIEIFTKNEWKYFIDSDGDLGGMWESNQFFFFIAGEKKDALVVQGRWHDSIGFEQMRDLQNLIDEWNATKLWPKCYSRTDDDGRITVLTEVAQTWRFGATEDQLQQQIMCALSTSVDFFKHIETTLEA